MYGVTIGLPYMHAVTIRAAIGLPYVESGYYRTVIELSYVTASTIELS